MFSYYGSKSKVVHLYPKPKYKTIIEPFCGSARYSLRYFENDIILMDKYDVVIKIWKFLQQASVKDILSLPEPEIKQSIDNYNLSEGEKLLLGFIVWRGAASPQKIVQETATIHETKIFISKQLYKIRHWNIVYGDYLSLGNLDAVWFVDPPYQKGGHKYNQNVVDYDLLGKWCKERRGQVIACDTANATWLPFYPLRKTNGNYSKGIEEGIWSNLPHDFMARQDEMFSV